MKAAPIAFAGQAVHAGTIRYVGQLRTGDQQTTPIATEVTTVASSFGDRPAWLFVQAVPGQSRVDTVFVDRATLTPLRYVTRLPNGPAIEAAFRPDSVLGQITFGADRMPIRVHVAGPIYVVSAALWAAVATLPLAPGYSFTLRTIDVMEPQVTEHTFQVTGMERIQVPAGEFEAFRLEAGPLRLWIERAPPHRVLREQWPDLLSEMKTSS